MPCLQTVLLLQKQACLRMTGSVCMLQCHQEVYLWVPNMVAHPIPSAPPLGKLEASCSPVSCDQWHRDQEEQRVWGGGTLIWSLLRSQTSASHKQVIWLFHYLIYFRWGEWEVCSRDWPGIDGKILPSLGDGHWTLWASVSPSNSGNTGRRGRGSAVQSSSCFP